jgi:hypothetical protein
MKVQYVLLIILFSSCTYDPPLPQNEKFKITNTSEQDIFCYPVLEDSLDDLPLVLNNETRKSNKFLFQVLDIPIKNSKSLSGVSSWEGFIDQNSRDSLIRLFIFSKALVKEYGWKDIISTGKYTKKYIFNEHELNKNDWKITYKGN